MASIKLKGDTSGEITIDVPAVAGTNTLTLPASTGNVVTDSATQTLTNKTLTTPNIDSAQFATVSGTAPLYGARAWVNFNGTGTVAIRDSGNVSSITDNSTGDYTVNFTTALSDANYTGVATAENNGVGNTLIMIMKPTTRLTTSCGFISTPYNYAPGDCAAVMIAIFR
jgi:hypothetical protein